MKEILKNQQFTAVAFSIALLALLLTAFAYFTKPTIGFVDNVKLFEEFAYKKELAGELATFENRKKAFLDSLELNLRALSLQLDTMSISNEQKMALFNNKRSIVIQQQQNYEQQNQSVVAAYDDKIAKRLSDYIQDFAKDEGIDLLIGNTGNGAVMHGEKYLDYTEDALKYINQKYSGQ
jgi:outer membrane protein